MTRKGQREQREQSDIIKKTVHKNRLQKGKKVLRSGNNLEIICLFLVPPMREHSSISWGTECLHGTGNRLTC